MAIASRRGLQRKWDAAFCALGKRSLASSLLSNQEHRMMSALLERSLIPDYS
jgi:hypothetical protein